MYLIDTNVISELRKKRRCNTGVQSFFSVLRRSRQPAFLSVVTVGELRRGLELSRYRGDERQARQLERWLDGLVREYRDSLLDFTVTCAQVWGRISVPDPARVLDQQIAATALTYGLTVVTRNERDFAGTGADVLNPFQ